MSKEETQTLVQPDAQKRWNEIYAKGSDKNFPNLDLVRLEKWFFENKPGRLLEYGFGCGVNLLHLLNCGYDVDAVDASIEAKKRLETRLEKYPALREKIRLHLVTPEMNRLPFADATFDRITCVSVLSLLGSWEKVSALLKEFVRVLKPGGKTILDINGPESDFARDGQRVEKDVYVYRGASRKELPVACYCPPDASTFAKQVAEYFEVDDVGYSSHKYFQSHIQEFIVCAHKQ